MEQTVEKKKNNMVKLIDRGCQIVSCSVLFFIILLLIISQTPAKVYLPTWLTAESTFRKYLIPIFSSAAVGYLTNAVAIWMLFKPYEKHWFWPQGVIPRQKKNFGHELGILIPQHLLQPEKISAQIGRIALQYLQDPLFVQKIRVYVRSSLVRHSGKLAQVVVPYVRDLTVQAIRENMTREKFDQFCRMVTHHFLTDADTRMKTVQGTVVLFKDLLPGLSGELKKAIAERVGKAFREEHPILSWCKDNFTSSSIEDEVEVFWQKGEKELFETLEEKKTQQKIAEYFTTILLMGKAWTEREENSAKIDQFLLNRRQFSEKYASEYLADKIPEIADQILCSDSFWIMLQEKALPALQLYVVRQLRGDSRSLLTKVDLPGKIENAVDKMNMKDLHSFVIQASNDNLTLLQIFGFFLGGFAGLLMAFVI